MEKPDAGVDGDGEKVFDSVLHGAISWFLHNKGAVLIGECVSNSLIGLAAQFGTIR